jgi:uncharacterized protein (DUF1778 family)
MEFTTKKRIQVYADDRTKRQVELAASKQNMPVTQYCLHALLQQLAEDSLLEEERIEIPVESEQVGLVARIHRRRVQMQKALKGRPLSAVDTIESLRNERSHEASHLF